MPFGNASDISIFFRDGDDAVLLSVQKNFKCHFDLVESLDDFGGQAHTPQVSEKPQISYATEAPGRQLTNGDFLQVSGRKWTVRYSYPIGDGAISIAVLKEA